MAELKHVETRLCAVHPANPRRDLGNIDELTTSIRNDGVLQPLLVVAADPDQPLHRGAARNGVRWLVVAGQRRLAAARKAGLQHVPVAVHPPVDEWRIGALSLAENLARKSLNPIEEAEAFQRLLAQHGWTQNELAEQVGCSQGLVSKRLKLLQLTEEQKRKVATGQVSVNYAEKTWIEKQPSRAKPNDYPSDRAPKGSKSGGAPPGERGARIADATGNGHPHPMRRGDRVQLPWIPAQVWRTVKYCANAAGMSVEGWLSEVVRRAARSQLGDDWTAEMATAQAKTRTPPGGRAGLER